MVKKGDGSYRFCVDFRQLNHVTTHDRYPLPRIDDLLDQLGKSKYFTSLDLASRYWQIPMNSALGKAFFSSHGCPSAYSTLGAHSSEWLTLQCFLGLLTYNVSTLPRSPHVLSPLHPMVSRSVNPTTRSYKKMHPSYGPMLANPTSCSSSECFTPLTSWHTPISRSLSICRRMPPTSALARSCSNPTTTINYARLPT